MSSVLQVWKHRAHCKRLQSKRSRKRCTNERPVTRDRATPLAIGTRAKAPESKEEVTAGKATPKDACPCLTAAATNVADQLHIAVNCPGPESADEVEAEGAAQQGRHHGSGSNISLGQPRSGACEVSMDSPAAGVGKQCHEKKKGN